MATVATRDLTVFGDDMTLTSVPSEYNKPKDDHAAPEPPQVTDEVKRNRVRMVLFHFAISYPKWSVSIFLFLASLTVPLLPSMSDAARQPYESLQAIVKMESRAYYQCTVETFEHLHDRMIESANQEYVNVLDRSKMNQGILEEIREIYSKCSFSGLKAQEAMHHWSAEGQLLPFLNESLGCSEEDRSYIATSLGEDFEALESEVSTIMGVYTDSSQSSLDRVRNYANERLQYDYDYFVRDRIHPLIELLKDMTVPGTFSVQFSVEPQALVAELFISLEDIEVSLITAKRRIDLLLERLNEFYASLENFKLHYDDLYDRLIRARIFIRDFAKGLEVPDYLDLREVPVGLSLLPPVFEVPDFQTDIGDIDYLMQNFSDDALIFMTKLLQQLEEEATNSLRFITDTMMEQIREILTLEDYDPPKYQGSHPEIASMEQEASYLSQLGEAAKVNTMKSIAEIQGFRNVSTGDMSAELPELKEGNFSFSGNATTFDYEKPILPTISIPELLSAILAGIITYQWLIEMIIQSIRLWRLKNKYERDATPDLPEIDFGTADTEEEDDDEDRLTGCVVLVMTILRNLLSPWMILFLLTLPLVVLGTSFWYPHIQEKCVDSRNGTYLANNILKPLLVNQANAPGHALHTRSEFDCRRRQRRVCDQMYAESDVTYRNDIVAFSAFLQKYNQSTGWNSRLGRCIDTLVLDDQFNKACCGLEGYATNCSDDPSFRAYDCPIDNLVDPPSSFRPLGEYISDPACHVNTSHWVLKDSRFDCQALEDSCSITPCDGVDEGLIRSMTIEADCLVELYLIRIFTFVFLVLYHAVMINLFCTLIFNGLKFLMWRKLKPDGIKLKTQVDESGNLVKGTEREHRSAKILAAIRKFELQGWFQLAFGAIFFLFWSISFSQTGKLVID